LLSRRQALEISDVHFLRDVADLIEALKRPGDARTVRSPKWIKPALASIAAVCALAAGIGIWTRQNPPHPRQQVEAPVLAGKSAPPASAAPNISGNWLAVLQKDGTKYEIYFTFEVVGDKLLGKAYYPTGEAGILNGTIGQGRISFTTKHVPNFATEEATITVEGRISGDEIQVFTQDQDGLSKGVAHRVDRISQPKVLTHR
jgi:hypothetical protein